MLFLMACLYILVFYYQPGARYPILGEIRFEFLLGTAILGVLLLSRNNRIITHEKMSKAAGAFLASMLLSFIGAAQSHTGTEAIDVFITFVKAFSVYIMIVGTVDSQEKVKTFVWVYVLCMAILIVEPYKLSLQGQNLMSGEGGIVRLYGVGQFAHPNGLGTNSVTTLALIFYLAWFSRSLFVRLPVLGLMLISLRVVMMTASRTAYVGMIVLIFYIFAYSKRKMAFLVAGFIVCVILLGAMPDMYRDRFFSLKEITTVVSTEERQYSSIGARWRLVKDAWIVFLNYPIFGCGMDSFRRISFDVKGHGTFGQTHNLFMQILAETGIVGLIGACYFFSTIWKTLRENQVKLIRLQRENEFLHGLMIALQVFFLTKLTVGLVAQHNLYSNIWWIVGGLTLVSQRIIEGWEKEEEAKTDKAEPTTPTPAFF